MGKYSKSKRQDPISKPRAAHPLWQGIGCILIVVIPIFSYAVAYVLVEYGIKNGWPVPPTWYQPFTFPPLLMRLSGLSPILIFLTRVPHLKANLLFTVGITILFGGVLSVFYAFMYRTFGPPRYGPMDAPPSGRKAKAYKR